MEDPMPTRVRGWLLSGLGLMALLGGLAGPAGAQAHPAPAGSASPAVTQPTDAYLHLSTTGNIAQTWTNLEHPALNDQSNARFLVASVLQPEGGVGDRSDRPLGVRYDIFNNRWQIYNDDLANMAPDLAWNVIIPPQDDNLIMHTT